jgi:hypothetical protein
MTRLIRWLFAEIPDEVRDFRISQERMQEALTDFLFRIAEMTLVCGAVVFIEKRLNAPAVASPLLAAIVALYARSRATAGMLTLMKDHHLDPRRQRLFYWLIVSFALLLWAGIIALTNFVVPLIAQVQTAGPR